MRSRTLLVVALVCAGLAPAQVHTQSSAQAAPKARASARQPDRQPVGTLSGGDSVFVETRSVKRAAGITTAAMRVRFRKPAKVGATEWRSSRTIVMVDCTKRMAAVKENWYYLDDRGTKVANHKVVGIPGYGAPVPGSVTAVAVRHFCS